MKDAHPRSFEAREVRTMMTTKRSIEIFTAGCPLCDDAVRLVNELKCRDCEVTIHNLGEGSAALDKAKAYGIHRVPAVVVDGKLAECCNVGPITAEGLKAAGVGREL
jgi:glutaredoxin